jgi:hypothetical protein
MVMLPQKRTRAKIIFRGLEGDTKSILTKHTRTPIESIQKDAIQYKIFE